MLLPLAVARACAQWRCRTAAVRARHRRSRGLRSRREARDLRAQRRRIDGGRLDDQALDRTARASRCSALISAGRHRSIAPVRSMRRHAARGPRSRCVAAIRIFRSASSPTAPGVRERRPLLRRQLQHKRRAGRSARRVARTRRASRAQRIKRNRRARHRRFVVVPDPGAECGTGAVISPIVVNETWSTSP